MLPPAVGTRSVGVGDVSLAVAATRGVDRSGVARALSAALEAGLDLVDLADDDDSERLAGEVIRELRLRDKITAAARIPALTAKRDVLADRVPARYIQARVESALRCTRLDVLPLAQLELRASWRSSSAWPELVGTCERLIREGKVLAWGALVDQIEDDTGDLALEPWLVSLSLPFSLCERAAQPVFAAARAALEVPGGAAAASQHAHLMAAGLRPELVIAAGLPPDLILAALPSTSTTSNEPPKPARETPIKILARRPLAGGALAGSLGPGAKLRQRDDRNALGTAQLERIAVATAKLARFVKQTPPAARSCDAAKLQLEIMKRPDQLYCDSLPELALRYVVTQGCVALPRLHRHEHVIDALAASVLPPLPADLVAELEELDI